MGRKTKVSYEDKIKACEDYISGTAGAIQIAERLNLGKRGDGRSMNGQTSIAAMVRDHCCQS